MIHKESNFFINHLYKTQYIDIILHFSTIVNKNVTENGGKRGNGEGGFLYFFQKEKPPSQEGGEWVGLLIIGIVGAGTANIFRAGAGANDMGLANGFLADTNRYCHGVQVHTD